MSNVLEILVAASPDAPMARREEVRAVAGRGLEDDRYFAGRERFHRARRNRISN
jgi:hypothetical protein